MKFNLLGKEIKISNGRKNYMEILSYFEDLWYQAKKDFEHDYEDTFGLTFFSSSYAEKFASKYLGDKLTDFVMKYVKEAKKFLLKYGVYDLTDKMIWNAISEEQHGISYFQARMEDFILEYCDGLNDQEAVSKIKANMDSGYFVDALRRDIMALCDYVIEYVAENKILEIEFVYESDASKAEAIYENLEDNTITDEKETEIMKSIPAGASVEEFLAEFEKRSTSAINDDDKIKLAFQLIELDPRKERYYEYIFENFPQARFEIAAIAKHLNRDLSDFIEEDIERTFNFKSIAVENDALAMMDKLNIVMKRYGVSTSKTKTELEKILHAFDIEARTYDNVLYETRELREQAKIDDNILKELYGESGCLDKETCQKFVSEISDMTCTENIKNKHIGILQNRVFSIDKEFLEGLIEGLAGFDEAECERVEERINQYDTTQEIKAPFLTWVQERIHDIWDAEDFERFSEIFKQVPVSDINKIRETGELILKTGRTETKELFSNAVYCLVLKEDVEAAAKYAVAKESGTLSSIINIGKKSTYEKLTLDGRVMHPAVLEAIEEVKAKKANGFLANLKKGKLF